MLNKTLSETMMGGGGYDPATLGKHVDLLDKMFATIVEERVFEGLEKSRFDGETAQKWLKLALQCQKQCNDTAKNRAAINYMRDLQNTKTPPHPLKMIERTSES